MKKTIGYPGDILKLNLLTATWSYMSKKEFNPSLYISLSRVTADQEISPTHKYYILGHRGRYGFLYHEEKINRAKNFLQFNDGEAAFLSHKTSYFQTSANARTYLEMKNSNGEFVLINDATFEKYNKNNIDHKEW